MPERRPKHTTVSDVAFRYSDYDTPFWARPNTSPGRWQRPRQVATQYLCLQVDGAWAELIRAEELTSDADASLLQMPMWAARIEQAGLADLSTFDRAEAAGVPADALVDEDHERCQRLGDDLREAGFLGVVAPSAALPEATNVTLFGPRYATAWQVSTTLASAVPAQVIARGAPPLGLVDRVRQRGEEHAGLAAWRSG